MYKSKINYNFRLLKISNIFNSKKKDLEYYNSLIMSIKGQYEHFGENVKSLNSYSFFS